MELEELKKSWNVLDEHLKDKELIKEEELSKLLGHTGKGIHAIANLNIKLILISLPILILFLAEVPVSYTHLVSKESLSAVSSKV